MIELEVGQVLVNDLDVEIKIVGVRCCSNGIEMITYTTRDEMSNQDIRDCYTLITNADGTSVEKPKKYKELTPVEAVRLLADAGEPVECEFRKHGPWIKSSLTGVSLIIPNYPFSDDDKNVYKRCRIEVSND